VIFPSFGDAADYDRLGRACAAALSGQEGRVFDACYHPVRPPGVALFMSLPHLLTADAVDAAYIALALNLLCAAAGLCGLYRVFAGDAALLAGWGARARVLGALVFASLVPNLVPHLPVRLGDLPALAVFLLAVAVAARVVMRGGEGPSRRWQCALAGVLCAASFLLKISQLPAALLLMLALVLLPRGRAPRARMRDGAAFLVGFAPALLQFLNVWAHGGHFWFYDPEYMRTWFSYPGREWGVDAMIFERPQPGAYLVRVDTPISLATLVVLRLYRGLFGFEWAIYHDVAARGPWWSLSTAEWAAAWLLVLGFLALSAAIVWRGPPSLRLLNAVSAPLAVVTAVVEHTELRYYALPRTVLWLSLALIALQRWRGRA